MEKRIITLDVVRIFVRIVKFVRAVAGLEELSLTNS